jgi:hypothetical protein
VSLHADSMPRYADDVKISSSVSVLLVVAAVGCGRSRRAEPAAGRDRPVAGTVELGALARADLLRGDWVAAEGEVPITWLRPGTAASAIYGVAGASTPVVWVVDDEPTTAPRSARRLRMWRYRGDAPPRVCDERTGAPDALEVACEEGAGGTRFWQNGAVLDIEEWSASTGPDQVHLTRGDGVDAPALEDADRRLSADTAARGAPGWAAWFADDGVMWRDTTPHRGKPAITAAMIATLEATDLRWQPTVSRMLVPDALGVTAGTFTATPRTGGPAGTGTYVTVWRNGPDGWKIIVDLGRPDA